MLAYNLNCWLLLFNREAQASVENPLRHTTLATARLTFSVRGGQVALRRQNGCSCIIRKRACLNG